MALPITEARKISETQFLSSDHINGFLVFIRKFIAGQNLSIKALYNLDAAPCLLYEKIPEGQQWVQVLHDGSRNGGHWITAAFGFPFIPKGCVGLYDSLDYPNKNVLKKECSTSWPGSTVHMKKIIASLIRPRENKISIILMPCSKQTNGYDCGPHALANATALVMGLNPSNLEYNSDAIREHTKRCLIDGNLVEFPFKKIKRKQSPLRFNIKVYCICRLTERLSNPSMNSRAFVEEQMVNCNSCDEWYHRVCLSDDSVFNKPPNFKWHCPYCPSLK